MPQVSFKFPFKFQKLDDGRMLIEGTATDETLDSQGDILDYEGSKKAFGDWRGNIREAHDVHKMVGKALEVTFDDSAKAINVKAFISKGAQDTQAKIEEGVLSCFSVGGGNPTKSKYEKVDGKQVRRVLEWPMSELSTVDAGANPNATFQLVKADGVATDILAEDVPAPVADAANRFAAAILKAVETKPVETPPEPVEKAKKKADEEPDPEDKKEPAEGEGEEKGSAADAMCDKCNKVHKEGMEACNKEDLAAADTARAKKGVEEAKAKHKIARAKEDLVAAKGKLEEVKAGGAPKPEETPDETEKAAAAEMKKTARSEAVKKAFEEWDIRSALEILEGLKALLFNETTEPEAEPPAEKGFLETAITAIKAFIASEAAELAATQPDGSEMVEAAKKAAMQKAAADSLDGRLTRIEEMLKKSATVAPHADLFKVHDGDQLAEGIGKGLSSARDQIAKANVELKGLIEAEFKDIRKSIVELGKTAAVPTPLRTVPLAGIRRTADSDNGVDALERVLMSTDHPETQALLRQQIAIAKAGVFQR